MIDAALLVEHGVTMEACGNELIGGGVGQHVAGKLFDRKLTEGHILIERVDHPIAVFPHRPAIVFFIAVRVGVAREIKPRARAQRSP